MPFWAYMLHCRGGVFYTGHTDDLEKRVAEHKSGRFAGFTKDRHPLELVWSEAFPSRDEALAAERRIKGWSRKKKLALIRGDWDEISRLARSKNGASTSSARTDFIILRSVIASMRAHAVETAHEECCGLLLGRLGRITKGCPARNVSDQPSTRFEIDPVSLIAAHRAARSGGPALMGYYHSHPAGHPVPSATDCEHLSGDGRVWAIVAGGDVTFWRDDGREFTPLSPQVIDG